MTLAMSAAVISTTAVSVSAVLISARVATTDIAAPAVRISGPISIPAAVVAISRTPIKSATIISATVPRASSDKHATCEIVRSIVAIRCARIRRIAIIAVGANRRRSNCHANGSYSHANANLRASATCTRKNQ